MHVTIKVGEKSFFSGDYNKLSSEERQTLQNEACDLAYKLGKNARILRGGEEIGQLLYLCPAYRVEEVKAGQ